MRAPVQIGDKVKHITGKVGVVNRIVPIDGFTDMCQVFSDDWIFYGPRQEWERVDDDAGTNEEGNKEGLQ